MEPTSDTADTAKTVRVASHGPQGKTHYIIVLNEHSNKASHYSLRSVPH